MNRSLILGIALAAPLTCMAPTRSNAAPGDLDLGFGGFGTGGQIQNLGFEAVAMAIDAQGRLVLVGSKDSTFYLQRRSGPRFNTIENRSLVVDSRQTGATATAVAIAPDGKIVVAGAATFSGSSIGDDFAVVRLNSDLTPDTTFAGGSTLIDFNSGDDVALAVAVQSDNKIIVAGQAFIGHLVFDDNDFAAVRFNENGTLDASFNGNGRWTLDVGTYDTVHAIALQSDGKILLGGDYSNVGTTGGRDYNFAVIRLNSNGSTDSGFGHDGLADTGFGGDDYLGGMTLAPDGKIVLVGTAAPSFSEFGIIAVARYQSDGKPDTTFDGDGKLTTDPMGGRAEAFGVVVQPDGKTVVAAHNYLNGQFDPFYLVRYTVDGSLDPTFGINGEVFNYFGTVDTGAFALALQKDGDLIVAGHAQAARYRWDGNLDAGGIVDVDFDPSATNSIVRALTVQDDGKLIAGGSVYRGAFYGNDMALARFTADRSGLDPTFGNDTPKSGHGLLTQAHGDEAINAVTVRDDGKIVVAGQAIYDHSFYALTGRFDADGTADSGCANAAYSRVDFGHAMDSGNAVAIGPGDKTYLAGTVFGATNFDYGLVRFKEDCSIDDTGGIQLPVREFKFAADLGGNDYVAGMVLQGARAVIAGQTGSDIVLIRTTQDLVRGFIKLDTTFGLEGKATLHSDTASYTAWQLAQQSDGSLLVSGQVIHGSSSDFIVVRFTANGQLDTTFGDGGVATVDFDILDTSPAIAVRNDDTIAIAGCASPGSKHRFAVAQLTKSGQLDSRFHGDGKVTLQLGPDGNDCPYAIAFVGSDHIVAGGSSEVFGRPQFALASFQTSGVVAPPACTGDCDGDQSVTVDELVTLVNIALGDAGVSLCPAGDVNRDSEITIDEILSAVNNALNGCPVV